jgi:hypothetical protein
LTDWLVFVINSAVSCSSFSLRATRTRAEKSVASLMAVALPIPWLAPVTMAVFVGIPVRSVLEEVCLLRRALLNEGEAFFKYKLFFAFYILRRLRNLVDSMQVQGSAFARSS